jgi:peptidyl-prolyl cis-trans isomerase A (cyclophilin A)
MLRQLRSLTIRFGSLAVAIFLASCATAEAGTLVTINMNVGNIQVELFDGVAVNTVDNFLGLVTGGNFSNTIIHRSSPPNGVIQGGGFDTNFNPIANHGTIPLEYTVKHVRGTLGMARTADPNSATSQWFINTQDNSGIWAPSASSAGYAAFGWVVSGMNVVDSISAMQTYNAGGAFGELPLKDYNPQNQVTDANKIIVNSITVTGVNNSFTNPVLATDVNNDGNLNSQDALTIINDLQHYNTGHAATAEFIGDSYKYFDPNGDSRVNSKDLLFVFNAILAKNAAQLSAQPMATPLVVPEPATWSLLLSALAALGVVGWRRRKRLPR